MCLHIYTHIYTRPNEKEFKGTSASVLLSCYVKKKKKYLNSLSKKKAMSVYVHVLCNWKTKKPDRLYSTLGNPRVLLFAVFEKYRNSLFHYRIIIITVNKAVCTYTHQRLLIAQEKQNKNKQNTSTLRFFRTQPFGGKTRRKKEKEERGKKKLLFFCTTEK